MRTLKKLCVVLTIFELRKQGMVCTVFQLVGTNLLLNCAIQIITDLKLWYYLFQCNYLEVLADYANFENDILIKNLAKNVTQLWNLNNDSNVATASWYQRFTKIRCDITVSILKYFSSVQLLQVNI